MQQSSSGLRPESGASSRIRLVAIALVFAALAYRLFHLTSLYAVNIYFWDQWDFNEATLFQHHSLWQIFRWQHGPHRQGLGGLLSALIGPWIAWNGRSETFVAAGILVVAAFLALWLKYRIFGRFSWMDVLIPAVMLSPAQWESVWTTVNFALVMFPLLMMAYCLLWVWENQRLKYGLIVLLNFGAIHTGFAFFLGLLTPALLIAAWRTQKEKSRGASVYLLACLSLALISLAYFFTGWRNQSASGCSSDAVGPGDYLGFVNVLLATTFGITDTGWPAAAAGGLLLAGMGATAVFAWRRILAGAAPASSTGVLAILSSYLLLFTAATAAGRACLGVEAAQSSRYLLYLNMGLLCLYFGALTVRPWRKLEPALVVILVALPSLLMDPFASGGMMAFRNTKAAWRTCYLSGRAFDECTDEYGLIYPPDSAASAHLPEKLAYLKATHRNLFAGGPDGR